MVYCPHTFNPQHHELNLMQSNTKTIQCVDCNGFIQICGNPKCNAPNRLAAQFCTTCGSELETESLSIDESKLVKGVSKRVNDSSEYRLDKTLGCSENDEPLLWISGDESVFIFTHNPNVKKNQLNLYYISAYKFQPGFGERLTNESTLPELTEWTQLPLVSRQGIFISTNSALHYFPAHGYDKKYEHQVWKANESESILSVAIEQSGNPSILIKNSDNKLVILEGNAQSGIWGNGKKRHELNKDTGNGAFYLITADGLSNDYWIYNGIVLIRYNTDKKEIVSELDIKAGTIIPLSLEEKLEKGYFTPFIIEDKQDALKSVIPISSPSNTNARVGVLPEGNSAPRRINDDQQHIWIKPYPSGEGFALGLPDCIKGFVGDREQWTISKSNTKNFPPLMLQNWFAVLVSFNFAHREGTEKNPAILFEPASQHKGHYTPEDKKRMTGTIEKKGLPIPGLPPLYSNGNMFIALQNRNITTIYQIQVSG